MCSLSAILCVGQYGAPGVPGGGERRLCGVRSQTQPATLFQGGQGVGHVAAQPSHHCSGQQVSSRGREVLHVSSSINGSYLLS